MSYVDGFVLVVPKKNIAAYKKMATEAGKLWKKLGAVDYVECVGDDMRPAGPAKPRLFPEMAKAKKGEVVLFSYITYKSRAHRDAVNKKVMAKMMEYLKDPKNKKQKMPFDEKRMAYGGFKAIVEF